MQKSFDVLCGLVRGDNVYFFSNEDSWYGIVISIYEDGFVVDIPDRKIKPLFLWDTLFGENAYIKIIK